VLDTVLIAGDEAPADPAVVRVLARVVEQVGVAVETLDDLGAHRRLLAQPDGGAQHEDVGRHHLLEDAGPLVALPTMLGHVGPHARGDVVVDGAHQVHLHALAAHDLHGDVGQALGVGLLGRPLEGAVDEQGPKVREVPLALLAQLFLHGVERHASIVPHPRPSLQEGQSAR
jgi:hypothetical protein